jgi:putative protease
MSEVKVGKVTHYFDRLGVAVFEMTDGALKVGDTVHIVGHTTNFTQLIDSMQVEHQSVPSASVGQSVGVKVTSPARQHDEVLKVVAD